MPLQLKDETTGIVALEISGGGALIGIDGASGVHILAVCGNPIIKSNGVAFDNTVVPTAAVPATGSVTTNGSGDATVTTNTSQKAVLASGASVKTLGDNAILVHGSPGSAYRYSFW